MRDKVNLYHIAAGDDEHYDDDDDDGDDDENISNVSFPLNVTNIIGFNGADIIITENQYVHVVCYRVQSMGIRSVTFLQ